MYYIWLGVYEYVPVYRLGLYLEFYLLVSIHENREPSDLLGPWVPYCVVF